MTFQLIRTSCAIDFEEVVKLHAMPAEGRRKGVTFGDELLGSRGLLFIVPEERSIRFWEPESQQVITSVSGLQTVVVAELYATLDENHYLIFGNGTAKRYMHHALESGGHDVRKCEFDRMKFVSALQPFTVEAIWRAGDGVVRRDLINDDWREPFDKIRIKRSETPRYMVSLSDDELGISKNHLHRVIDLLISCVAE